MRCFKTILLSMYSQRLFISSTLNVATECDQIGKVSSVSESADDSKKLRDVKLCIGDYLDVAIHPVRDSAVPADASG